jgi:hypothetical protein
MYEVEYIQEPLQKGLFTTTVRNKEEFLRFTKELKSIS